MSHDRTHCLPGARRAVRALATAAAWAALLVTGAGAGAADLAEAIDAYRARDFARAREQLEVLAADGEPRAQTILGIMFETGEGAPRDAVLAARWYRIAAEQGYDPAQYSLANLYRAGRGVPRDAEEAAYWYAAAARQGNQWAAARLEALPQEAAASAETDERSVIERKTPEAPRHVSTGITSDRLDALVARVPGLRAARRSESAGTSGPSASPPGPHPETGAPANPGAAGDPPDRRAVSRPGEQLPATEDRVEQVIARVPASKPAQVTSPLTPEPVGDPVPAALARSYGVQVASTRSRERTEHELARVADALPDLLLGAPARVIRIDLGEESGVWFRGLIGDFPNVAAAEAACEEIQARAATQGCFAVTR